MADHGWPGYSQPPPDLRSGESIVPSEPTAQPGWAWRTTPRPGQLPSPRPPYESPPVDPEPMGPEQWAEAEWAEAEWAEADWAEAEWSPRAAAPRHARADHRAAPPPRPAPARSPAPAPTPADEPAPALLPTLLWTLGTFLAPVLLYLGWTSTLSDQARPGCVDPSGGLCAAPQEQARTSLVEATPALLAALGLALLVAVAVRRLAGTWRVYQIAFASGVIGAGAATLVATLFR